MKVAELTGELLDYWANRARGIAPENIAIRPLIFGSGGAPMCHVLTKYEGDGAFSFRPHRPSTNWQDGGPIIQRESISLQAVIDGYEASMPVESWPWPMDEWQTPRILGATALIAAMRAFVASRFGDTVPDEVQ